MTTLEKIEQYAHDKQITIIPKAIAGQVAVAFRFEDKPYIAVDYSHIRTDPERIQALSHELAHLEASALSGPYTTYETQGRDEHRTWSRVIEGLLPQYALEASVAACEGRLWDVAEDMGVPESLVRRAIRYYRAKEGA